MRPTTLSQAAASLAKKNGVIMGMAGDDYSSLEWQSELVAKPTLQELQSELLAIQEQYDSNEYQRLRESAYPSTAQQFDALYHGGYDAWKEMIDVVKNKYPKPE